MFPRGFFYFPLDSCARPSQAYVIITLCTQYIETALLTQWVGEIDDDRISVVDGARHVRPARCSSWKSSVISSITILLYVYLTYSKFTVYAFSMHGQTTGWIWTTFGIGPGFFLSRTGDGVFVKADLGDSAGTPYFRTQSQRFYLGQKVPSNNKIH